MKQIHTVRLTFSLELKLNGNKYKNIDDNIDNILMQAGSKYVPEQDKRCAKKFRKNEKDNQHANRKRSED